MIDRAAPRHAWRRRCQQRHHAITPIASLLTMVALASTMVHRRSFWYADFRFEHNDNPGQWAMRMGSVWDTSRGFGTFRSEIWPAPTAWFGVLRALGLSMATSQQLFHAALLTGLGVGVVVLIREWQPRIGFTHLGAALFAMFAPFSITFLLPSGLFISYVLLPWLLVVARRAITTANPWRWAAISIGIVAAFGTVDRGGLAFTAIAGIVMIVVSITQERVATWASTWAWVWRSTVMGIPALAAIALGLAMSAEVTAQDLRETELATFVNSASSWPESWRGLGFWQVYLRDFSGWVKPQALPYSTNLWSYGLSFVVPIVALLGAIVAPRAVRVMFGSLLGVALVVMVGTHPVNDPSPYGRVLRWLYDAVPPTQVLRNSYKAGAIATLAIAVLFGVAVGWAVDRARKRRPSGSATFAVGAAAIMVVVAVSHPVWTRGFNGDATGFEAIPDYVPDAMAWLDDQGGDARALFVPGAVRNGFRWGDVNDDILDAMLDRPHLTDVAIHTSRPVAADILSAIDDTLVDRRYRPGWARQIGERFGIEYLVLRNDIDWQVWGQPRPIAYEAFRDDPATTLVASFGDPGEYTIDPTDESGDADAERRLPPIEIYRIAEPGSQITTRAAAAPLVVSGDGDAFALLDEAGLLPERRATTFSGNLDPAELADAISEGSPLIITDTNRRVAEFITQSPQRSHTLAAGTTTERSVEELFERPGSETTAVYGDVVTIDASTLVSSGDAAPWHRPAQALDDSLETSWLVGGLANPVGERFRVNLSADAVVGGINVVATRPFITGDRQITAVRVSTSAGTQSLLTLDDARAGLTWPDERLDWVEVEIAAVAGLGLGPVGFTDIELVGVDTTERLVVADDVLRGADADPRLADALDGAPVGYVFARLIGTGPVDEERTLYRRFRTPGLEALELRGELELGPLVSDELLARIEGGTITAVGSGRYRNLLAFRANAAFDGDPTTAWAVDNRDDATIELTFAPRRVRQLEIQLRHGSGLARPSGMIVRSGDKLLAELSLDPPTCELEQCRETIEVPLTGNGRIDKLTIEFPGLRTGRGEAPIRIEEVTLDGRANEARPTGVIDCLGLVIIDGEAVTVSVEDREQLLAGSAATYTGCQNLAFEAGWHEISSPPGVLIDTVAMTTPGLARDLAVTAEPIRIAATQTDATRWVVHVDGTDATILVLGQSWHPGWQATMNGVDLGEPAMIDGVAGWQMPAGSGRRVEIGFAPQRTFEFAMLLSIVALAVIGSVAVASRPAGEATRRLDGDLALAAWVVHGATTTPVRRRIAAASGAIAVAYLVGRWPAALICAVALLAASSSSRPPERVLAAFSATALSVAALSGLVGHRFGEATFGPGFSIEPDATAAWGRYAGVLLIAAVLWSALATPAPSRATQPIGTSAPLRRPQSWGWPALASVTTSFVGTLLVGGQASDVSREATRAFELGRGTDGARALDLLGTGPLTPAVMAVAPFAELLVVPMAAALTAAGLITLAGRFTSRVEPRRAAVIATAGAVGLGLMGPTWTLLAALLVGAVVAAAAPTRRTLGAGTAFGAAMLTHTVAAPVMALVIAAEWRRGRRTHASLVALIAVAVWVPWLVWRARNG